MAPQKLSLAETQAKFKQFYQKKLQKDYENLEIKRIKYLKKFWLYLFAYTALLFIVFAIHNRGYIGQDWFSNITAVVIIAGCIAVYMQIRNYRDDTKNMSMKKVLSFWGNFSYHNSCSSSHPKNIKSSELFAYYNCEETDESFSGSYNGTSINVAEQELHIKGNKHDIYIFRGVLILLDFQKKYNRKTVVISKGRWWGFIKNNPLFIITLSLLTVPLFFAGYIFLESGLPSDWGYLYPLLIPFGAFLFVAIIYFIYRHYNPKKATQKVVLEDLSFLRKWNVYTNNQIDARYILTPHFMEKIVEIKRLFHGHAVDFSFFGGKLLIAVHTNKDMFETTSLFRRATDYRPMAEVVEQLHSIFSVIDVIKAQKNISSENINAKTNG